MKDLDVLQGLHKELNDLKIRQNKLKGLLSVVRGGTQQRFTLTCGDTTFELQDFTRNYTYDMKPSYDMVKLGLIKGLDKEIDKLEDSIIKIKKRILTELSEIDKSL